MRASEGTRPAPDDGARVVDGRTRGQQTECSPQGGHLRLVGYVREAPVPAEGDSAFAQTEVIRRFVAQGGHQLIALCQDVRQPGHALGREGYQALLGILKGDRIDGVAIASLEVLSADKINQEILMWDLRTRGVKVLSANPDEVVDLGDSTGDKVRLLVRDVLLRVQEHFLDLEPADALPMLVERQAALPEPDDETHVIIELLPADEKRGSRA